MKVNSDVFKSFCKHCDSKYGWVLVLNRDYSVDEDGTVTFRDYDYRCDSEIYEDAWQDCFDFCKGENL